MSKFLLLNYFTSFLLTTIILKKKRKSTVVIGVLTVNQSNTVLPSDWSLSTKTTPPTCTRGISKPWRPPITLHFTGMTTIYMVMLTQQMGVIII